LAFYVEILKFSISYQRKEEGFAFLTLGDAQIMIDEIGKGRTWKTGELNYPFGRGINFQIKVKSIDPLVNSLKKNNIELFLEPEEKWYAKDKCEIGHRQFLVMDPDGYLLRFAEELGKP
jgi:hypothetical protein